ncbi:TonB-dependent receptor [Helicobacter sp. T3_23-1059]
MKTSHISIKMCNLSNPRKISIALILAMSCNVYANQNPQNQNSQESQNQNSHLQDLPTQKDSNQNLKAYELEKITTTANKYEAEIQSVNSSVQVVKQKQLSNANIKSTTELSSIFAGLQIQDSHGTSVFPMASLRGISSPDYYTTTLNLYVDGVPQSANFLIQALGDVEAVELLRGAQGTLYGENSQAGLISIRTKNPMKGDYANVSLTGSKLYEDLNAYIGGELVKNKLWGKASVRYIHDNGFIKYGNKNMKDSDSILGGASLYYAPTSAFLATLSYNFHYVPKNTKGFWLTKSQYQNGTTDSGWEIPADSPVADNYGYGANQAWQPNGTTLGQPNAVYAKSPWEKLLAQQASLKLDYDFGGHLLSSITAFNKTDSLTNTYPLVQTYGGKKDGYFYDITQVLEELRLDSEYSNGIRTTFGAYYKHLITDNGMRGFIGGAGDMTPFGFRANWSATERVNTIALFGDGYFPLGQYFDIGFGGRYQYYHASIDSPLAPGALINSAYKNDKGWHTFNPRISFGFNPNEHIKLYIAGTHSTKMGGFAKFPYADDDKEPYNPEQIYSAELGSHLRFLDSALMANLAVYYSYIQDRQAYVGNSISQSIKNIGDAYSTGFEADISYNGERLYVSLGTNIGIARYTNGGKNVGSLSIGGQPAPYDVRGKELKYAPLVSLTASADWNFLRINAHRLYVGGNARFYTKQYFDDLIRSDDLMQKPYVVLDFNTRYEYKNFSFKIFAQNVTNTRYALYARQLNPLEPYYLVGNPWNLGAQVAYKY